MNKNKRSDVKIKHESVLEGMDFVVLSVYYHTFTPSHYYVDWRNETLDIELTYDSAEVLTASDVIRDLIRMGKNQALEDLKPDIINLIQSRCK